MPGGTNLATKFSTRVDEAFERKSFAALVTSKNYDVTDSETVKIYSFNPVQMGDYSRSGMARYGTPDDVVRNIQTEKIAMDRCWTAIIDQGDRIQSMMLTEAGRQLSIQNNQVIIPEYDKYVIHTIAKAAFDNGNTAATAVTKANAYEEFLKGQEALGDAHVPMEGRVCLASYKFGNLLRQDSSFVRYGDVSQEMLRRGELGTVDGVKLVLVPKDLLPTGADFVLTHPVATCAPKQLVDYKVHDNPPGINGWLMEGRMIYDAFVLNQKKAACYYHGTAISTTAAAAIGSAIGSNVSGDVSGG